MDNQQHNHKMQALFTIVDYSLGPNISEQFIKHGLPIHVLTHGHGAANEEIYDLLGFGEPKKAIIFSIVTKSMAGHILSVLQKEANLNKPGTGIAFTVPINGISNVLSQLCISSEQNTINEREDGTMLQNEPYDLILTIVNSGSFSQVMDVAKAAGAKGGTLIHGRSIASEETAKFLAITIQPEKDIILILATHEHKQNIMESITKEFGLMTDEKGICFSVPVDTALGLGTKLPGFKI